MVNKEFAKGPLCFLVSLGLLASACLGDDTAVESGSTSSSVSSEQVEEPAEQESVEQEPAEAAEPAEQEPAEPAETDPAELDDGPFAAVTAEVEAFVEERDLDGAGLIIVHRDDGVLYHEHFGEFSEDRISMIASSSKMISAGVLLKLQEQGFLDIDAPVESVASWAIGNPDITPAQLVSNSSGLVGLGPDLFYAPYVCQWAVEPELQDCAGEVFSGEADDALVIPPDTQFRYGGAQWQVAGGVAEAASGKSWAELIEEIYIGPCGVESLGFVSLGAVFSGEAGYPTGFAGDPEGVTFSANPSIEGGAHITTGDYGKLLLMHLRGGMCGDNQVLSQESLDTMHTDRIGTVYDGDAGDSGTGYGMGWWVNRQTGRISDGGAWGALPWLDLDDGYGAYIIVEASSEAGNSLKGRIEDLVHEAVLSRP